MCADSVYSATPEQPHQGEIVIVRGPDSVASIRLLGRTVPLYAEEKQPSKLGLIAVPVLTKPGVQNLEWLDAKGEVLHAETITIRDAHYLTQNVVLTPGLAALHSSPGERQDVGSFLKERLDARYWPDPFHLEPPLPGCITSPFGVRRLHNGKPTGEYHAGLDQRGAAGSPIRAIAGGEVKLARQFELRGGTVAIDHGQGFESIYLHMSKTGAVEGTHVQAGDVVGYVGSTGRSTGPHLHWTMYVNGEPANPLQWMKLVPCPSMAKPKAPH